jgi:hypothetical protein
MQGYFHFKVQHLIYVQLLALPLLTQASDLRSENLNSNSQWSTGIKLSQDINKDNPRSALSSFDLGYTYSLQQPDSTSQQIQWIATNAETLGLDFDWGLRKIWNSSFEIDASSQPAENFTTKGFEWDLYHRFYLGSALDPDDFQPSFKIGFKLGNTTLTETAKVKVGKVLVNDLIEPQVLTGFVVKYYPLKDLNFTFEYDGYQYSPTINKLALYLNNSGQTKASGFSTALGQLNIFSSDFKMEWDFSEDWEIDLTFGQADGLTTGSMSYWYESLWVWHLDSIYTLEAGALQNQPSNTYSALLNLEIDY